MMIISVYTVLNCLDLFNLINYLKTFLLTRFIEKMFNTLKISISSYMSGIEHILDLDGFELIHCRFLPNFSKLNEIRSKMLI